MIAQRAAAFEQWSQGGGSPDTKWIITRAEAAYLIGNLRSHANTLIARAASDMSALDDIKREREYQNTKWGQQNHDDEWWLAILMEEVGEAAQGVLHNRFGGQAEPRPEIVQIAAVALAWLECIDHQAELAA